MHLIIQLLSHHLHLRLDASDRLLSLPLCQVNRLPLVSLAAHYLIDGLLESRVQPQNQLVVPEPHGLHGGLASSLELRTQGREQGVPVKQLRPLIVQSVKHLLGAKDTSLIEGVKILIEDGIINSQCCVLYCR